MYLTLKSLHLIFMVAWFAELFYIFRLYVYHVKHKDNAEMCKVFEVMEYKLLYFIGHLAMGITLIIGFSMIALNPAILERSWIVYKIFLVLALIAYQIFAGITRRKFAKGNFFLTEKQCRLINEVPAVLLIGIVLLAVFKPV